MDKSLSNRVSASPQARANWYALGFWLVSLFLLFLIFREYYANWLDNVSRKNSYYSHAFLVPFVSLFFVWRMREDLAQIPKKTSNWGYVVLVFACLMVLGGDLLGIRMLGEAAVIPLTAGMTLIFLGARQLRRIWFPLAFLLFMIPLPESMTTSITFHVKMLATDGAVLVARACLLPMIRDGSYVRLGDDYLLVGDVCGGLRSLISLLAFGAIVSYISDTNRLARVFILLASVPVAILSNMVRIFLLCVVAHFWGSGVASGWVHDVSGLLIYAVALALLFGLDRLLHRIFPSHAGNWRKATS
ncbi:MAG: exosortase/archaeosortase family protein [Candidatus Hydrogenedentales bacterium]|jgi:exosortase